LCKTVKPKKEVHRDYKQAAQAITCAKKEIIMTIKVLRPFTTHTGLNIETGEKVTITTTVTLPEVHSLNDRKELQKIYKRGMRLKVTTLIDMGIPLKVIKKALKANQ